MFATKTIGVITRNFESLYHTPLIHMLHARLRERGYRFLGVQGTPGEIAAARVAFDCVDGWLVINTSEGVDDLRIAGKPIVLVSAQAAGAPCVVADNRSGTTAAISHLIAQRRTRIAFVTYAVNPDFQERYAAYTDTLAEHGLALDPDLVLDVQSYLVHEVYQAVRRMIAEGRRFDAAFCANDWLAFGTMQAVQEAGWRIPEDVAVIGFDDTTEAQFATPPLTSVRQDPVELGCVALELLLDQIERGIVPSLHTTVPTELIIRQSSIAAHYSTVDLRDDDLSPTAGWSTQLARDLVQQLIFPKQLALDSPPEQVWPGVNALVMSFTAMINGREPQDVSPDVWSYALSLNRGGDMLSPVVELLRSTGVQRIDSADRGAVDRLTRWLMACQRQIMHQQLAASSSQAERDRQLFMRENMLFTHASAASASPRLISWMDHSSADWAVLGLWRDGGGRNGRDVIDISSEYVRGGGASFRDLQVSPECFPPLELLSAPIRDSLEYLIKLTPLAGNGRQWGYLAYAERFCWTFNDTASIRNGYIAAALEREELLNSLNERQTILQEAYDRERHLADTIRELGCPIIPLLKGVLLVPLVGAIDEARAAQILERMLEGVGREQAQRLLLDITGVPLVDSHVAAAFVQMAQAVGLLGAKVTLVGVRPEIAQSIVGLGVDLGIFETRPSLSAALQSLVRQ